MLLELWSLSLITVRLFTEFSLQLIQDWQQIEKGFNVFPQSRLCWIKSWYDVCKIKEARIFVAYSNGRALGILPMREETILGVKTLISCPTHFGDFFDFIHSDSFDWKDGLHATMAYIMAMKIDCLHFNQLLNSSSILEQTNSSRGYIGNPSIGHVVDLSFGAGSLPSIDDYLAKLSKNRREKIKKSKRLLGGDSCVVYEQIESYDEYISLIHDIRRVYVSRWGEDLSDRVYEYRNKALQQLFSDGVAVMHVLKVNGTLCAYHIGFYYEGVFYSWKEANDERFSKASVGMLMKQFYIPSALFDRDIYQINFMAGDYEYKRQMSSKGGDTFNILSYCLPLSLKGAVYAYLSISIKPKVKVFIENLQKHILSYQN